MFTLYVCDSCEGATEPYNIMGGGHIRAERVLVGGGGCVIWLIREGGASVSSVSGARGGTGC